MIIGRRVYGLAAIVLAVPGLAYGSLAAMGQRVPAHTPGYAALVVVAAGLLILAGLAINTARLAAVASFVLAGYFGLWLVVLHLPNAVAQPMVWVSWESVAEVTVSALGGVIAFALAPGVSEARAAAILRVARPAFGLGVVVFGISEFVYARFTASLVPAWLPPSQLAWTYLTGAAQIAAGLAILSGVRARLAAVLLTTMFAIFGLIVHLPRVIASPSSPMAWSENGVNLVLCAAAWVLADSLGRPKPVSPPAPAAA